MTTTIEFSKMTSFLNKYRKNLTRFCRHIFTTPNTLHQHFPASAMRSIQTAIEQSETQHFGEIRFAVEANLSTLELLRKKSAKRRAIEVFSNLRVWDTEQNNGVLIYLLLADHDFEILADRGIHQHVGDEGWAAISKVMEQHFRQGAFEAGVLHGISAISGLLTHYYPANGKNDNELSDVPVIL